MSKVIFFIRPMHGHVNPTLQLVSQLVREGEEVIYYSTDVFKERIESTGAVCRIYPDSGKHMKIGAEPEVIIPDADRSNNQQKSIGFEDKLKILFANLSRRMEDVKIQDQLLYEKIEAEKPGYIIYDYMDAFWGKMIAQKLQVPAIASIPSFAICEKFLEKDPAGFLKYVLHLNPDEPLFKNQSISIPEFINFISSQIASIFHIDNFKIFDFGNSRFLNIVYNSRYFQPHGELFDETFHFIGSQFERRPETVDFPYERLGEKPVIYISLGTVFNRSLEFYKECCKAFGDSDKQVVMAVGTRIDLADLGDIPGNLIVRPYVPQLEILNRAGLFITHGGLNSVKEGIFFNVPLMVLPQQGDQFAVAYQVQRLGAGISFEHSGLTAGELRKYTGEAYLNEEFRQNCKKIKESLESGGGAKRAVDEINKLKERIGIR